jgi:hypothetical protein
MNNDLSAILKDIEFGPVDKKLTAIGNLNSMKGISLETVGPLLENVIAKTSDDSVLKFYALTALVIHGDQRDVVVDALVSCSNSRFRNEAGEFIHFSWLARKVSNVCDWMTDVAVVEALSHIHGSERVANWLHELLAQDLGEVRKAFGFHIFIIYAMGAIGSPISRPVLEYYRDNRVGSWDGNAARIALEHFGEATFFEIKELHAKSKSSGCFIATAVYGKEDAPEVQILRHFRDEVLLISFMGRRFVSFYYQFSPYAAKLIGKSVFVKSIIRAMFFKPFIWVISSNKGGE